MGKGVSVVGSWLVIMYLIYAFYLVLKESSAVCGGYYDMSDNLDEKIYAVMPYRMQYYMVIAILLFVGAQGIIVGFYYNLVATLQLNKNKVDENQQQTAKEDK